jgi:hypothetical protein
MQDPDQRAAGPSAQATPLRTVPPRGLPPRVVMRAVNVFVRALLRSPLHGVMSKQFLILGYTGRKSGERYHLPIVYRREGAQVTLVAGHPWWVNVRGGAAVTLQIAGAAVRGVATPVEDRDQAGRALLALLEELPHFAKMYKATLTPEGRPDPASVRAAVETQVVVSVALDTTAPAK